MASSGSCLTRASSLFDDIKDLQFANVEILPELTGDHVHLVSRPLNLCLLRLCDCFALSLRRSHIQGSLHIPVRIDEIPAPFEELIAVFLDVWAKQEIRVRCGEPAHLSSPGMPEIGDQTDRA